MDDLGVVHNRLLLHGKFLGVVCLGARAERGCAHPLADVCVRFSVSVTWGLCAAGCWVPASICVQENTGGDCFAVHLWARGVGGLRALKSVVADAAGPGHNTSSGYEETGSLFIVLEHRPDCGDCRGLVLAVVCLWRIPTRLGVEWKGVSPLSPRARGSPWAGKRPRAGNVRGRWCWCGGIVQEWFES